MSSSDDVGALPTFVAIDALAVLAGRRRGTSVQVDDAYFDGQLTAMGAVDEKPSVQQRRSVLRRSKAAYANLGAEIDSIAEDPLRAESERLRERLRELPEVQFLQRQFPGTCFVVPEWLRTGEQLQYGARIYFFRDDDAPSPAEIIDVNVDAVVREDHDPFERLLGRLHGYPNCCNEWFQGRTPDEQPREQRSIEPLAHVVAEDLPDGEPKPSTSIDDLLPGFFDSPHAYAFFAREFFPEPGCRTARETGLAIHDALVEDLPEPLVRDHFRLNFGWNYLVARVIRERGRSRPAPGSLGREHLLSYLPLATTA